MWYNPNIHPFLEYERRLQTLQRYLFLDPLEHIIEKDYHQFDFIKGQILKAETPGNNEPDIDKDLMTPEQKKRRCEFCYRKRIERVAYKASELGFDSFSTTMLISKHQDHEKIRKYSKEFAEKYSVEFIYKDLRKKWKDSVKISKELRLYRQPYCGCIFSEYERYNDL
jgi:hypothetical protein